jgi:hypothetical protein
MRIHKPFDYAISTTEEKYQKINPIPRILEWKMRLDNDPQLTVTEIAKDLKISRVRVGQLLEIAELDGSILERLKTKHQLDISISQLRKLSRFPVDQQTLLFQTLEDSLCSH